MAESTSSGRTLSAVPTPTLTDWSGISLTHKKEVLRSLYPTCIVRAVIANEKNGASEAIYFEITKIKDGTCWGKVMDTYRFDDYVGLEDGRIFSFPLKAVVGTISSTLLRLD